MSDCCPCRPSKRIIVVVVVVIVVVIDVMRHHAISGESAREAIDHDTDNDNESDWF